jgi:hypothetical protein
MSLESLRWKAMSWALQVTSRRDFQRFGAATREPAATQAEVLARIVGDNRDTAFGREHDFAGVRDARDFRARVPVRDYEGLRPYVQRQLEGVEGVLTREPAQMFAMTSGTTGEPKYIPVTAEADRRAARLMRLWLYGCLQNHPRCFDHGSAALVSPAVEAHAPSGVPCGNVSGRIQSRLPGVIRGSYVLPYEAMCVSDYQDRYFLMARYLYARPPSVIGTPNAATLLRIVQVAEDRAEDLIRAIRDGTLGVDAARLPPHVARLAAGLSPDPQRARVLEYVRDETGGLKPRDAWGYLELIGCWLGGSAGLQVPQLKAAYGDVALRDLGWLASEGRMSLPLSDGTAAGVLALDQGYYEFVPADDEHGAPRECHELEEGREYSVLLTTFGGLYRYDINDIVRVAGFHRATPLVEFVRKGKDMTNLQGEKLHVNHLFAAVRACRDRLGLPITDYRLAPLASGAGYVLQIELPRPEAAERLGALLDEELGAQNCEYRSKRESRRLEPLVVQCMPAGWREGVTRALLAGGRSDIQFKWRYLVPQPVEAR